MSKTVTTAAIGLLALSLTGCGPRTIPREEVSVCRVYGTAVAVDDGTMTISFKEDCQRLISGYYVYISREPLVERYPGSELPPSIESFNHTPFPGDTEPDDAIEHFEATGLENGVKYYASVRVVFPDRTLSEPSNEVMAVCGPRGEIELAVRYTSDRDGFSFEQDAYVEADALNNDIYFFSKDGVDYLGSPSRLGGFLKRNAFGTLPLKGDFDRIRQHLVLNTRPTEDRLPVAVGDWIHVLTEKDTHALVKVLDISEQADRRHIRLFYAYCPLAGEPVF